MQAQEGKFKLFYENEGLLHPKDYIFDNTYRNMSQKKKFQRDPKFAYFNAILKMKNNYRQNKQEIYKHVFGSQSKQTKSQYQTNYIRHNNKDFLNHQSSRQTFHVEKINNHSFKIYKDKKNSTVNRKSIATSFHSLDDINFQMHFKRNNRTLEKPKIQKILNEYSRIRNSKINSDLQRNLRNKIKTGTLRMKQGQTQDHFYKGRRQSFNKPSNQMRKIINSPSLSFQTPK